MICHECNSPDFDVTVKEELGYDNDPVDLGLEVTHCPFCGANLEWAQRGGYDASEYDHDEERLDA
jgi:hypothetical protein